MDAWRKASESPQREIACRCTTGQTVEALTVDAPLPNVTLPLTVETAVTVDLEQTYQRAVEDAYMA